MKDGYLSIETHADRNGIVRLVVTDKKPDPDPTVHAQRRIRYIARFNDIEAAVMHSHEILKRRLIDPDAHMYRVPLERAIGAVESLDLRHRRIYLDADFADAVKTSISNQAEQFRRQRKRRDAFFQVLGYIALAMLLLQLFALSQAGIR